MPYDIPRPSGYRIQPFKLQDDEALVAAMAQQLLKARLAQARAASGGGGGGGGRGGKSGGSGKGEWVMKYNPETKRYDKVWIEGKTKEEREINAKGEDFNKTADWLDSNPEAQRLLGVLRNGKASNAAKQKALAEFRSLKGAEALEGMSPEAVEEVVERQAKPYKEQVEAEKKEIAGAGRGILSNVEIGLDRLGTFFSTIGDDAETALAKRRASLERQQAIRDADPYLREQSRREAEGEGFWDRSSGIKGVAANAAGALLSDPSALPVAGGALLGGAIGGPAGAAIGASLAAAGGAASGDAYLAERLVQDERLSEAEKARAYDEGKALEMGVNAAVNAVPFGGGAAVRAGRTALAAAGRGALGREALASAENFARNSAWRTAEATADYARRFGGLAGEAAEQAVSKAAMRPIAADLVRNSERGLAGTLKYGVLPETAAASALNAGAMLESNIHYNELTGQNDSVVQGLPQAAGMGLLFGIPSGIGRGIRARREAAAMTSPETRLAADQLKLDDLAKKEAHASYGEAYGVKEEKPAEAKAGKAKTSEAEGQAEFQKAAEAEANKPAEAPAPSAEQRLSPMDQTPSDRFMDQFGEATFFAERGQPEAPVPEPAVRPEVNEAARPFEAVDGAGLSAYGDATFMQGSEGPRTGRTPAKEYAVSFSAAESERLGRLNQADWPEAVKRSWRSDPSYAKALGAYEKAAAERNALQASPAAKPDAVAKADAKVQNAFDLFDNVVKQLMLRDEDLLNAYRPGRMNGEARISEAGTGAAVSGAGRAGEAGARQADTGAGGQVGADTQNAPRADAGGVPPQAGVRNPQDQGGGTGGRSGGSPAPAQNPAGVAGAAGAGRKPRGKGAVGKRGAGDAAQGGADAGQVAGGNGHPAEPGTGGAPAGGSPAPEVARPRLQPVEGAKDVKPAQAPAAKSQWSKLSKKEAAKVKNILHTVGAPDLEVEGVAAKAGMLNERGMGRELVAELADRVAAEARGAVPAKDRIFFTQRSSGPAMNAAGKGVLRLADHYGIPPVKPETIASAKPAARPVLERINGIASGVPPVGKYANMTQKLRTAEYNTPEWRKAAGSLLNADMLGLKHQMAKSRGVLDEAGTRLADFYGQNFDKNWKTSGNPIDGADVHYAIDPEGAMREADAANAAGTPKC